MAVVAILASKQHKQNKVVHKQNEVVLEKEVVDNKGSQIKQSPLVQKERNKRTLRLDTNIVHIIICSVDSIIGTSKCTHPLDRMEF